MSGASLDKQEAVRDVGRRRERGRAARRVAKDDPRAATRPGPRADAANRPALVLAAGRPCRRALAGHAATRPLLSASSRHDSAMRRPLLELPAIAGQIALKATGSAGIRPAHAGPKRQRAVARLPEARVTVSG